MVANWNSYSKEKFKYRPMPGGFTGYFLRIPEKPEGRTEN